MIQSALLAGSVAGRTAGGREQVVGLGPSTCARAISHSWPSMGLLKFVLPKWVVQIQVEQLGILLPFVSLCPTVV